MPTLFLDRDGILIEDTEYPFRKEDLRIIDDVIPLMKWAKERGWSQRADAIYKFLK